MKTEPAELKTEPAEPTAKEPAEPEANGTTKSTAKEATEPEAEKPTTPEAEAEKPAEPEKPAESGAAEAEQGAAKPTGVARRRRVPFAHAVRMPRRHAAVAAARAGRAWSRRPSGRLTLPGLFLLALVAGTAAAGALLVPASAPKPRPVAVDGTAGTPGAGTA
ncbi:murein transglycosylase, partial [Micromonospora harpali]